MILPKIAIVGSSGHAKVVSDIVKLERRFEIAGYLDSQKAAGTQVLGSRILGRVEDLPNLVHTHGLDGYIIAIGDNFVRHQISAAVKALGLDLPLVTAVHPAAVVAGDVTLGAGTVVMAGAVINPGCGVGELCIINTRASLDHDSLLEDCASLGPNAATGGNCQVGFCAVLGISSTLIHRISVGEHTVIGAGAVVLESIGPCMVALGCPARNVRGRVPGEPYL